MNSQVYCLPQKFGFNAVLGTSWERHEQQKKYTNQSSVSPFFTLRYQTYPQDSLVREARHKLPGLSVSKQDESIHQSLLSTYITQHEWDYGTHSLPPLRQRVIPRTHEATSYHINPHRRTFLLPLQDVELNKGTPANDGDRGFHEWRCLISRPESVVWEPLIRIPFSSHVGKRYVLPPVRVTTHDPAHEKKRWDNIKSLDAKNCLAYGYRRNIPGYAGHTQMVEDITSNVDRHVSGDSKCMESTVQASYKELPDDFYQHGQTENINKHQGPLSRMVTLTHPFNPFTQQSAYSNMGAANTVGSSK